MDRAMNVVDVKHLFSYTEWANDLAMEAASKLPDESLRRDFSISHSSINVRREISPK